MEMKKRKEKKKVKQRNKQKKIKNFSPGKFSRFLVKTNNWYNNKNSFKTKKYFQDKVQQMKNPIPKFEKSSFIPYQNLQNMVEVRPNFEVDNEVDFFSKDVRKKNVSLLNFTGTNFLFDR